jgi:hypothetical protein
MCTSLAFCNKVKIETALVKLFPVRFVNKTARECGFVKRKSKLNAMQFLLMNVFSHQKDENLSLQGISQELLKEKISITKQSIQNRYNAAGVIFMRKMLSKAISQKLNIPKQIISSDFKRIILGDATNIQLPEEYRSVYKGNGGSASGSSMKIQYSYDLLSGNIQKMEITDGCSPDARTKLIGVKKTTCTSKI